MLQRFFYWELAFLADPTDITFITVAVVGLIIGMAIRHFFTRSAREVPENAQILGIVWLLLHIITYFTTGRGRMVGRFGMTVTGGIQPVSYAFTLIYIMSAAITFTLIGFGVMHFYTKIRNE